MTQLVPTGKPDKNIFWKILLIGLNHVYSILEILAKKWSVNILNVFFFLFFILVVVLIGLRGLIEGRGDLLWLFQKDYRILSSLSLLLIPLSLFIFVKTFDYFMKKYATQFNLEKSVLTNEAKQYLKNQIWEGNVRELENVIQRSVVLAQNQPISSAFLSLKPGQVDPQLQAGAIHLLPEPEEEDDGHIYSLDEMEKRAIERALKIKKGNILQVAKALGVSRTTLYSKIDKYNISV